MKNADSKDALDPSALLVRSIFGSDDSDSDQEEGFLVEKITDGFTILRQFCSTKEQDLIWDSIIQEGYLPKEGSVNQGMRFGNLPKWAQFIGERLQLLCDRGIVSDAVFPDALADREPLFDQMILNRYEPGDGIVDHVDLLQFEDGVIGLSLLARTVMDLKPLEKGSSFRILLKPGDLYVMHGTARYSYTHGIQKTLVDVWEGQLFQRETRASVTLRKLVSSREK